MCILLMTTAFIILLVSMLVYLVRFGLLEKPTMNLRRHKKLRQKHSTSHIDLCDIEENK